MNETERGLVQHYLSRLTLRAITAEFAPIYPEWRQDDEVPEYNRLYLITEGEADLRVDERSYRARAGDLCLLPAGRHIGYARVPGQPLVKYWCHFTADVGDLAIFDVIRLPGHVIAAPMDEARAVFARAVASAHGTEPTARLRFQAYVLELVALFLEAYAAWDLRVAAGSLQRLYPLLDYIDSHLGEDLDLAVLARRLHLHPNYFSRYFRRLMGVSPMSYVQQRRVVQAEKMLCLTTLTLSEIAERTGFADAAHLSNVLRKSLGMPPGEYRRLVQDRPQ